ncbi:MAG: XdhC/CoxI family protein [Thaumarchaeota archaeon]|nr:XdhC/CoxI family protein [Nitrososphaerota archaeon]
MSSIEFVQQMSNLSSKGENFATATVVGTKGSTTGRIGFKILIDRDGNIVQGNLGGGCSESVVVEQALEAMKEGKPRTMSVLLEEEEKGGIGANCGGSMEIYIEPFVPKNQLLVFGGGGERSIAGPLVRIAKILNFNVVVVDPGATSEMYPEADRVIPEFAERALGALRVGKNTSIVIVTKHKYDEPSVRAVAGLDVSYIGLVSSYHRASALFDQLTKNEGMKESDLRKIRVPIGLDIGAQSYEEIALSIIAEVIKSMKGGSGRSISDYKGVYTRVGQSTPTEQVVKPSS